MGCSKLNIFQVPDPISQPIIKQVHMLCNTMVELTVHFIVKNFPFSYRFCGSLTNYEYGDAFEPYLA